MSENQSPQPSSDARTSQGSADESASPLEASLPKGSLPDQVEQPLLDDEADAWETVNLPGTVNTAAIAPPSTSPSTSKDSPSASKEEGSFTSKRENELLSLIHDLNECNDALLSRVSQLEGAISHTQSALQAEVEKAKTARERMIEQMSADQASVQQISQTAQQQIAKLVSQLDTTEQALQRQQLIDETRQAELKDYQERVTQLEKESALISQQHAEEAQARIKAETASRDLRSRLQRQQRYTLQFKAALEKSLTVKARPVYTASATEAYPFAQSSPAPSSPSVTMPKAQRIMPWMAGASPFAGIDPHLETLIRNASSSASQPMPPSEPIPAVPQTVAPQTAVPQAVADSTDRVLTAATDLEAEDKLWQDLERVMNGADEVQAALPAANAAKETGPAVPTEVSEVATGQTPNPPKLNWQAAAKTARAAAQADKPQDTEQPVPASQAPAEVIAALVEDSFVAASGQSPAEVGFTEPSPWGQPLKADAETATTAAAIATETAPETTENQSPDHFPLIDGLPGNTVSPLVNPLRSQRRVGSMAAVQLPTFEKAKAGSFKR